MYMHIYIYLFILIFICISIYIFVYVLIYLIYLCFYWYTYINTELYTQTSCIAFVILTEVGCCFFFAHTYATMSTPAMALFEADPRRRYSGRVARCWYPLEINICMVILFIIIIIIIMMTFQLIW